MIPTNEQIIAEAKRRWADLMMTSRSSKSVYDFIIEVMRENWTPPEPVDPDILAFREWFADRNSPDDRAHILAGYWDSNFTAAYFLAGARAAREQERERAKVLLDYAWEDVGAPGGDEAKARSNRAFDIITKYEKGMR